MAKKSGVAALFTSTLEFDSRGKTISPKRFEKVARSISKQQDRLFVCSKLLKSSGSDVRGFLVSTIKGTTLSSEQKKVAKRMCKRKNG